jgi:hypothetical protein
MSAIAPSYVDHLVLNRHLKELLASRRWRRVVAVPHVDPRHMRTHIFDIFGEAT